MARPKRLGAKTASKTILILYRRYLSNLVGLRKELAIQSQSATIIIQTWASCNTGNMAR